MGNVIRVVSGVGRGYNKEYARYSALDDAGTVKLRVIEEPEISEYSLHPLINERKIPPNSRVETGKWNSGRPSYKVKGILRENMQFGVNRGAYCGMAWFQEVDRSGWLTTLMGEDIDRLKKRLDKDLERIIAREGVFEENILIRRKEIAGIEPDKQDNVTYSIIYALFL